jgi:hypothetical protein
MKIRKEWLIGYVDRGQTFHIHIEKKDTYAVKYRLRLEFRLVVMEEDIKLLKAIKNYFNCGYIRLNSSEQYEYRVRDEAALRVVVNFFLKNPLISHYQDDVKTMHRVLKILEQPKNLTKKEFIDCVHTAEPLIRDKTSIKKLIKTLSK